MEKNERDLKKAVLDDEDGLSLEELDEIFENDREEGDWDDMFAELEKEGLIDVNAFDLKHILGKEGAKR